MRQLRATLMEAGMWSGATCEMHFHAALTNLKKMLKKIIIVTFLDLPHGILNPEQ